MGRVKLDSYRVNCRISKQSGRVLSEILEEISPRHPKSKSEPFLEYQDRIRKGHPTGQVLSLLILRTPRATWYEILDAFPDRERYLPYVVRRQRKEEREQTK
jgi:hypothetical protein